ncbi:MAG: putative tricarboxylic transport rane protein [Clostridia bacterium]|nr:putative tricarboxylic transport rane protein [Clostridia bacterium]MDN5323839.1 putative tricarboxylic transport rane protein [Clostridia bacterium]
MKKNLLFGLIIIMALSLVVVGCGQKQEPPKKEEPKASEGPKEWKPDKPVEFVVPYSAGGGSDTYARITADIIQRKGLSDKPFMVVNKPGGSGAVGMNYVYAKKGDKYTIMTFVSGQVASSRANKAEVTFDKITPIANMALDEYILAVKKDTFKNLEEFINATKEKPDTISIGGSGTGNEDHMSYGLMNKYLGAKLKYVSFNGSGDVMTALLGGHLDAGIFNPNECLGQIKAGEVVPLATWSTKRLGGDLKDVPTFVELGYKDVVFQQFRGIAAPPDMPKEAVEFYTKVIKQVVESEEFKNEYWGKNLLTPYFLSGEDYKKFIENEDKKYQELLTDLGLMKK